MHANVTAESSGRLLATRLWELTDDHGMKDMLSFLIARDTMHQNQWLAVLEELGGHENVHPIPNSFPQNQENQRFNYTFMCTDISGEEVMGGRWTEGTSVDGKGRFRFENARPHGNEPIIGPPMVQGHAQKEEMTGSMKRKVTQVFR